jgi:hypothetical protein
MTKTRMLDLSPQALRTLDLSQVRLVDLRAFLNDTRGCSIRTLRRNRRDKLTEWAKIEIAKLVAQEDSESPSGWETAMGMRAYAGSIAEREQRQKAL